MERSLQNWTIDRRGGIDVVATAKERRVRDVAILLWKLGKKVAEGRSVENSIEVLNRLGISPALHKKLVRRGLLQIRDRSSDTFFLPRDRFQALGLVSEESEEKALPQSVTDVLTGADNNQTEIGLNTRSVDLCPGVDASRKKVALLIDWDNIRIGLEGLEETFSPLQAINQVRPLGDLAAAWVFTDTQRLDRNERVGLHTYGYEIIDCPRMFFGTDHTKDTVDPVIMKKVFWLITYCPQITTVVLATSDHDFLPCVSLLKSHGKEVVLMTARRYRGTLLQQQADQVLVIKPESGEELTVLKNSFEPKDYNHPDEVISTFVMLMAYCVNQMDRIIQINQAKLSFSVLKNQLFELDDFPTDRISLPVLEKILTFFRRQGVLKKVVKGRSHKTYYRLNCRHPFYIWSKKQ